MEDMQQFWNHRWVTPKAHSNESSSHGMGVFAKEDIAKGEIVGVLGGLIVPVSEHKKYTDRMEQVGIQVNDGFFICPSSKEEYKLGIFNHSCKPNCGFKDSITLIAMRDIKEGEELVFDYGFSETAMKSFECKCGSTSCRKQITGEDWKLKELQEKYFDYFSPYLKEKIR